MATLKHHWKFNENLQDAVGDCHLVDGGIPTYVQNKDGVDNSAMQPVKGQMTKSYSITDGLEKGSDSFSYSFWCRFVDADIPLDAGSYGQIIYRGLVTYDYTICVNMDNRSKEYRPVFRAIFSSGSRSHWTIDRETTTTEYIESWHFITITVESDIFGEDDRDANYIVRIYIDGVLRNTPSAIHTGKIMYEANTIGFGGNVERSQNIQIDEFKFFDGILDDGGLTVKGQIAKPNSEIWLLYLDGVNNRPRYTLNEATNVTATTATVSWTK